MDFTLFVEKTDTDQFGGLTALLPRSSSTLLFLHMHNTGLLMMRLI